MHVTDGTTSVVHYPFPFFHSSADTRDSYKTRTVVKKFIIDVWISTQSTFSFHGIRLLVALFLFSSCAMTHSHALLDTLTCQNRHESHILLLLSLFLCSVYVSSMLFRIDNDVFKFQDVDDDGECLFHCLDIYRQGLENPQGILNCGNGATLKKEMRIMVDQLQFSSIIEDLLSANKTTKAEWKEHMASTEWGDLVDAMVFSLLFKVNIAIYANREGGLYTDTRSLFQLHLPKHDVNKFIPKAPTFYLLYHQNKCPLLLFKTMDQLNHYGVLFHVEESVAISAVEDGDLASIPGPHFKAETKECETTLVKKLPTSKNASNGGSLQASAVPQEAAEEASSEQQSPPSSSTKQHSRQGSIGERWQSMIRGDANYVAIQDGSASPIIPVALIEVRPAPAANEDSNGNSKDTAPSAARTKDSIKATRAKSKPKRRQTSKGNDTAPLAAAEESTGKTKGNFKQKHRRQSNASKKKTKKKKAGPAPSAAEEKRVDPAPTTAKWKEYEEVRQELRKKLESVPKQERRLSKEQESKLDRLRKEVEKLAASREQHQTKDDEVSP
jgi:hypothetical protein